MIENLLKHDISEVDQLFYVNELCLKLYKEGVNSNRFAKILKLLAESFSNALKSEKLSSKAQRRVERNLI